MSNIPTIEELLRDAKRAGASDVHITVGIPPKMRVNGQLITMNYDRLLPPDTLQMLDQFMDERQRAMFDRDGEHDMSFSIPNLGRYRVNAYRQRGSVAIALRLVGTQVPSPEVLGVPESVIDLYQRKKGLILVTGPTGSGKSTTLYMILEYLRGRMVNISTIEDPVEKNVPDINQTQVNNTAGLTFEVGLRALLRQDPDIIMVGETRDGETAEISVRAAITGHMVLSTLHTNDAVSSILRLSDMGVENYLIANSLIGIVAQRLMRKVCPKCAREVETTWSERQILGEDVKTVRKGIGCPSCNHTGYRGRIAVHEILSIDGKIKRMISNRASTDEIFEYARNTQQMRTLKESAIDIVKQGISTPEELMKVAYEY